MPNGWYETQSGRFSDYFGYVELIRNQPILTSDNLAQRLKNDHQENLEKLFDSFAHNLQWDNVTLGKISGGIQAKINAEFPEARYHYKTHMIATHLPYHFLPRQVLHLAMKQSHPIGRNIANQDGFSSHELETLEVQKMNQRPYLLFEIHSMLLFHFTNG